MLLTDRPTAGNMPRPSAAFSALLLLLVTGPSAASVSPPTDVTVSCQNVKVTASWNCEKRHQQTTFRLKITGVAVYSERETTECQYNLTPFIWASEARYMNVYSVAVMAVQGGNQSEPMQSKTFSFNSVKTVDLACSLDFPPVEVNKMDSGVSVSFKNPFHFYPELRSAFKSDKAVFSFTITSSDGDPRFSCLVGQETCKHDVNFPEGAKECVTLDGILFDGLQVGQVLFRKSGRVCASVETSAMVFVAPLVIAGLLITVVAAVVCMVKPWQMREPVTLPPSLIMEPKERPRYLRVPMAYVPASRLTLEPRPPPSVSSEQEVKEDGEEEEKRISMLNLDSSGSEGHGTDGDDDDYTDRQADTRSTSVNSDEERSAYDCPHSHRYDLGDGDLVQCYGK